MRLRVAGGIIVLGLVLASAPPGLAAAAGSNTAGVPAITAARPGQRVVDSTARSGSHRIEAAARKALTSGEGAGRSFCGRTGGYALGAGFDNVYACGPATGTPDDFDTVGFQCVELSVRFIWVTRGELVPNVPDGKDLVGLGHSDLGIPIGTPGVGRLPRPGDVVSMWGGSNAQVYGHTAVVTSVNVDANGNGSIGIMEENGLASGSDHITVNGWDESYGDPEWGGGEYYYTHVDWLKLVSDGHPPPTTISRYRVHGLGPNSVAGAINGGGTVAGVIEHHNGGNDTSQPFVLQNNTWTYPGAPSNATQISSINDHGTVAAWAAQAGIGPLDYALHTQYHLRWDELPPPAQAPDTIQTASIDNSGDVAGRLSISKTGQPAMAIVWVHGHGTYQVRDLLPDRYFSNPIVNQTDHAGDAIGSQMLGDTKTFATVWAPWGTAYRLPSLSAASTYSTATAMTSRLNGGVRTLTVVGSSQNAAGVLQASEWVVTVTAHTLSFGGVADLAPYAVPGPSTAVAINSSGWVVGDLGSSGTTSRAFLWRPSLGMVDLQTLIPPASGWTVLAVAGINRSGQIVGQAHDPVDPASAARGVLLTPQP
jgi:probable HAF family extracellular repeat protein